MSLLIFCAVLLAALMHAGWNAVVKGGVDRLSSMLLLVLSQVAFSIVLMPFFPLPAAAALPWLIASAVVHVFYKLTLIRAYGVGDFSQVYPLARGSAPLMVTLVSVMALGEAITPAKLAAILLIGGGVCLMAFGGRGGLSMSRHAMGLALATGCFIATYTLSDGIGARHAGTASGFFLALNIIDGLLTCAWVRATRGPAVFTKLAPHWRGGIAAGAMAMAAYWIVIWGFTQAPIALVAALRETSVLFAVLIAVFFLKERVGPGRIVAACLIAGGVALMRL
ncbi:EamA family transporter [Microvirga pudoricolor]|uniref:EamA family transporter n=1 Tax=Microvirga pudoricolor TaxID=2778729 RepID=UPI00194F315C|nr:EamA family transporter [Microvirga pudoricolor]MBM6596272.1 EamA family transporter [Microvirga pudoricolor]